MVYTIQYYGAGHTIQKIITPDSDLNKLQRTVTEAFEKKGCYDFHITSIDAKQSFRGIDLKRVLSTGITIRQDALSYLEDDEYNAYKIAFLDYNIPRFKIYADDIVIMSSAEYTDFVFGHDEKYPIEWLRMQTEQYFQAVLHELAQAEIDEYISDEVWACIFADKEHSGDLTTKWFGDIFVYYIGRL